jgi:hypothetical protein
MLELLRDPYMHGLALLAVELVIGVVLVVAVTVIVLARVHAARMKKLNARYSPLPEFELDNCYAQSKPLHATDTGESSIGWEKEKYAHLSRAAGL